MFSPLDIDSTKKNQLVSRSAIAFKRVAQFMYRMWWGKKTEHTHGQFIVQPAQTHPLSRQFHRSASHPMCRHCALIKMRLSIFIQRQCTHTHIEPPIQPALKQFPLNLHSTLAQISHGTAHRNRMSLPMLYDRLSSTSTHPEHGCHVRSATATTATTTTIITNSANVVDTVTHAGASPPYQLLLL